MKRLKNLFKRKKTNIKRFNYEFIFNEGKTLAIDIAKELYFAGMDVRKVAFFKKVMDGMKDVSLEIVLGIVNKLKKENQKVLSDENEIKKIIEFANKYANEEAEYDGNSLAASALGSLVLKNIVEYAVKKYFDLLLRKRA